MLIAVEQIAAPNVPTWLTVHSQPSICDSWEKLILHRHIGNDKFRSYVPENCLRLLNCAISSLSAWTSSEMSQPIKICLQLVSAIAVFYSADSQARKCTAYILKH